MLQFEVEEDFFCEILVELEEILVELGLPKREDWRMLNNMW